MKLKTIFTIILLTQFLDANGLIYPDGNIEKFTSLNENRMTTNRHQSFLRNGQIYKDSRKIYVSFGNRSDIEKFCDKYDLTFVKMTNSYFFTALFEINSEQNVLTLCNSINQNEHIRYAKPNWKRERNF